MTTDTVHVVAALIRQGDRFLVTQRTDDDPGWPGHWEFPGGGVEPGESDRAALAREMREELAVEVEVGQLFERVHHQTTTGSPLDMRIYSCRIRTGEPQPIEVQAIRWIRIEEAEALAFPSADEPVLARIRRDER